MFKSKYIKYKTKYLNLAYQQGGVGGEEDGAVIAVMQNKDNDYVMSKVTQNGYALQYASEELKKDKDVVLAAVTQNSNALRYASEDLTKDKDVDIDILPITDPKTTEIANSIIGKEFENLQPPHFGRIHSSSLNTPSENLITALVESLSKHGFGGFSTDKQLMDFLTGIAFTSNDTETRNNIKTHINEYLNNNMSTVVKTADDFTIHRRMYSGDINKINFSCEETPFASGVSNSIFRGVLKNDINSYKAGSKVIVKICKDPKMIEDNFTELFIHAILSIYQYRMLNNVSATLITPFILTSYNKTTREFITLLAPVDGDIGALIRYSSKNDYKKQIAEEVIFYQSCGLIPLQKDLKFIHGDNHQGNIFYTINNDVRKYYFADFGYTSIMINSNLLCGGCFSGFNKNITAHNFSPRRDLMQITYVINRFFYKELQYDVNFKIPIMSSHIFNISSLNPVHSIYYPDIYTRSGLGNIGHDEYSIFNPKNMLEYFKKNKSYNVELCKNMIGDKWKEYIENNDDVGGASK